MTHKTKTRAAQVKALDTSATPGQFEAYVSVFGNKDSYGDVVVPTAFDDTLAEWAASGDPIPVVWSHRYFEASAIIGHVLDATPDAHGLKIVGQLDLEGPDGIGATARMVHHLMQKRTLRKFSFTYDVDEGGYIESDGDRYYELRRLGLFEVGPCLIGANDLTDLLDVKMREALKSAQGLDADELVAELATLAGKAGRTLSAATEAKLRQARDLIDEVVATVDATPTKTAGDDEPTVDRPAGEHLLAAKSAEALLDAEVLLADLAI